MELRRYWEVIRRRWWIVLALPLLVGLFSLLTYRPAPPMHAYDLQYSVAFSPSYRDTMSADPVLAAAQASEFLADDLTEILQGTRFFDFVASYLPDGFFGEEIDTDQQGEVLRERLMLERVEKTHRLLLLTFAMGSEEEADQLVDAIKLAIANDITPWLNDIWVVSPIRMELVNEAGPYETLEGLGPIVENALRLLVALLAGIALVLLLDYLDTTIRSRDEAEQIAGPVLAEIPAE